MNPTTTTIARRNQIHLAKPHLIFLTIITLSILSWIIAVSYKPSSIPNNKCLVSHGTYLGSIYTKPSETLTNKCLVESPWMRLAQHSVQLTNTGNDKNKVIDDWLWIDYHDRINVLVEAPPSTSTSGKQFMILEQTKYALNDMSLAVVGGIVEPNEDASVAAQREVKEELAVTCQSWMALGKFRTDVNRGMGWVHPYLARDCTYSSSTSDGDTKNTANPNSNEVGGHDTEKQHVKRMTHLEVKNAVMDGNFVEVQWSNTVALAMLHLS